MKAPEEITAKVIEILKMFETAEEDVLVRITKKIVSLDLSPSEALLYAKGKFDALKWVIDAKKEA